MGKIKVKEAIAPEISKHIYPENELVAHILFHRGVRDSESARDFLDPDFTKHTYNPFLFKGMKEAVARIRKAVESKEMVAVWADYDADGIPGAVVFHDFLKKIGHTNFFVYIPDRHHEGFGLNHDGIDECREKGATLIITIDCGITDVADIDYAKGLGVEVIVTDHHEPHDILPVAVAIIDHKQPGCDYPFKELCGAATIWKVVCAYLSLYRDTHNVVEGWEKWLLDMVGISTLSDMVPLVGENRVLAHYGLQVLRKSPRPGLRALCAETGVDQRNLNETDIGFSITPRINAASRMGVPMDAFTLLSATTDTEAITLAKRLEKINKERKSAVAVLSKEARKRLTARENDSVIVLGDTSWRPALLGLVANSLASEFKKPAFLWGLDGDGVIKGSCRSGGGKSVLEIMKGVKEGSFIAYGGHKASGGFEVSFDAIHTLHEALHESGLAVSKIKETDEPIVDHALRVHDVNRKTTSLLSKLAPFGVGNTQPLFVFESVTPSMVARFGKENNHLKVSFTLDSGNVVDAIAFFVDDLNLKAVPEAGKPMHLIASIEESAFRGRREIRLRIADIISA